MSQDGRTLTVTSGLGYSSVGQAVSLAFSGRQEGINLCWLRPQSPENFRVAPFVARPRARHGPTLARRRTRATAGRPSERAEVQNRPQDTNRKRFSLARPLHALYAGGLHVQTCVTGRWPVIGVGYTHERSDHAPERPPCQFRGHDSRLRGANSARWHPLAENWRHSHPDTVSQEANNPNPTGVYQLLDARTTDARDTKPTSYALTGHEAEFGQLEGQRVEVAGTVAPALGDVRSGKMAGAADGAQRILVSSVKKIEGSCSAAKK